MTSFLVALAITTLYISTTLPSVDAGKGGFSVEFIHRDSLTSPFYNPNETYAQRLGKAFLRSMIRARFFSSKISGSFHELDAQSVVIFGGVDYLMKISLGTPAFEIIAIADTGSDLIWTQCLPCVECYKQHAPIFDPNNSATYRDVPCNSSICADLDECSVQGNGICKYQNIYGDLSYTNGDVAVDILALGSTDSSPVSIHAIIGCGHNNSGIYGENGSGIVGLGRGFLSLISQLGSIIAGKFSYCLIPWISTTTKSSKLNFGSSAIVSGPGVQSTPLISKNPETFYFLTLEAVSVGNTKIKFNGSSFGTSSGNIIIDSGTTCTLVPPTFFSELASEVDRVIGGTRAQDPTGSLSLCYNADPNLQFPTLTVHFTGADLELNPLNTFIPVSDSVVCFTFNSTDSGAVFGNMAQQNFLIGYDLEGSTLSFKPADCTQY